MAESIAAKSASDVVEPSSAGLFPLGHIAPMTEQTLRANNYPITHLKSKPLTREALEKTDLIINLSGMPLHRLIDNVAPELSARIEDWTIKDPYGEDATTYQKILEEIEARVLLLAGRIRAQQQKATI